MPKQREGPGEAAPLAGHVPRPERPALLGHQVRVEVQHLAAVRLELRAHPDDFEALHPARVPRVVQHAVQEGVDPAAHGLHGVRAGRRDRGGDGIERGRDDLMNTASSST